MAGGLYLLELLQQNENSCSLSTVTLLSPTPQPDPRHGENRGPLLCLCFRGGDWREQGGWETLEGQGTV